MAELINVLGIDPRDILSTPSGQQGCDIYLSPAARKKFDYGVECKRQENPRIWACLAQSITNAEKIKSTPLLAFRRNFGETFVALRLKDFLAMQLLLNQANDSK